MVTRHSDDCLTATHGGDPAFPMAALMPSRQPSLASVKEPALKRPAAALPPRNKASLSVAAAKNAHRAILRGQEAREFVEGGQYACSGSRSPMLINKRNLVRWSYAEDTTGAEGDTGSHIRNARVTSSGTGLRSRRVRLQATEGCRELPGVTCDSTKAQMESQDHAADSTGPGQT